MDEIVNIPIQVVVYDNTTVHLDNVFLSKDSATARDKAVRSLGEDVDLEKVKVVVRPLV